MLITNILWLVNEKDLQRKFDMRDNYDLARFLDAKENEIHRMTTQELYDYAEELFKNNPEMIYEKFNLPEETEVPDAECVDNETISDWLQETYLYYPKAFEVAV